MTAHAIHLDKEHPIFQSSEETLELFNRQKVKKLEIEIIEIWNIDSPCDIALIITTDNKSVTLPLLKFRMKFLFQHNRFILDTSRISELQINIHEPGYSIEVSSVKDFNLAFYYAGDQLERRPVGFLRNT